MRFDKNLTNRFDRSAVNQVGQDGGQPSDADQATEAKTVASNRAELLSEFYKPELLEDNVFKNFFMILGAFIIPILGPAIWLMIAVQNFLRTRTKFYRYDSELILVKEKEHETGVRHNGYKKVKIYADVKVKSSFRERMIFIAKGIANLAIGAVMGFIQYDIYKLFLAE